MKIGEVWKPNEQFKKSLQYVIDKFSTEHTAYMLISDMNDSSVKIVDFYNLDDGSEMVKYTHIINNVIASQDRNTFLEHYEKDYNASR